MDLGLAGRVAVAAAASKGLGRAAFLTATTFVVDGGATLGL